jgi:uncharacterized protein (TIGR00369 family)
MKYPGQAKTRFGGDVSASEGEERYGSGWSELTRLQQEGIKKRLAENPVIEFIGIQLLRVAVGRATLMLPNREALHNSLGLLQGGIMGVLADVAGGVSLYSVLPDPLKVAIPTIEFKLNFFRPARHQDVIASGTLVHRGRQIAVCQVDIASTEQTLLAMGLFTYMVKQMDD